MKSVKAMFVILLLASLSLGVLGQEETMCAGEDVKLTDHDKDSITECLGKVNVKTVWKMPADKLPCFGVCILEKKEMLTADGKINHEKALKYIEAAFPDKVRKPLIDGIDKCIKEHGQNVKVKDDPGCSFLNVGQCVHDVFLDVCIE